MGDMEKIRYIEENPIPDLRENYRVLARTFNKPSCKERFYKLVDKITQ